MGEVAHFSWKELLLALVVGVHGPNCVPNLEVQGSPCPCPEGPGGYKCCETLSACIPQAEECPGVYPASSQTPCLKDNQCERGELCQAWAVEGDPAGPKQCRHICNGSFPCASLENCRPTLHDGMPLEAMNATRLCLSEASAPGCENLECSQCETSEIGTSYCRQNNVFGCLFALHPLCGLTCRAVMLEECSQSGCETVPDGAKCVDPVDVEWCNLFPCTDCVEPLVPGGSICEGDGVVVCERMPVEDRGCEQICQKNSISCPANWRCLEDAGAHCSP